MSDGIDFDFEGGNELFEQQQAKAADTELLFDQLQQEAEAFDAKLEQDKLKVKGLITSFKMRRFTLRADRAATTYLQGLPPKELAMSWVADETVKAPVVIQHLVDSEVLKARKPKGYDADPVFSDPAHHDSYVSLCLTGTFGQNYINAVEAAGGKPESLYKVNSPAAMDSWTGRLFVASLKLYVKEYKTLLAAIAAVTMDVPAIDLIYPKSAADQAGDEVLAFAKQHGLQVVDVEDL